MTKAPLDMKNSHFPAAAVTALACALVGAISAPAPAQAQIKGIKSGGGLFGLKKKDDQLSNGLFPGEGAAARSGEEEQETAEERALAEATRGQREEGASTGKPKKGGIFSFGRKSREPSDPVVPPIPPAEAGDAPAAARASEDAGEGEAATDASRSEEVDGGRKRGFGLPFFGNGDSREQTAPAPEAPQPGAAEEGGTDSESTRQPRFAESEAPDGGEERGGLFSNLPVPKIGVPKLPTPKITRKPTDYQGVEYVVKDGEFIDGLERPLSEPASSAAAPATSDPAAPPRVVDGVKTYSSWDQVPGRSYSSSERIMRRIRSHGN